MQTVQPYTRENPSPRYRELTRLYAEMHARKGGDEGSDTEEIFKGFSMLPHAETVKKLIDRTGARTVLDYGSGKGQQYKKVTIELPNGKKFKNVGKFWGVRQVACFDPGVPAFSKMPPKQFDGVVSTDVLEHCPEEDLPWILREMVDKAKLFVFATVALYPAGKILPNGENAHCTIKPPDWWRALIDCVTADRPELSHRFEFHWVYEGSAQATDPQPEILERLTAG